ncbi:uncharacterized protein LOC114349980 [Ostrinia furnacalis]|uniref:uncharacterized protein LOC114349980 n=1 Tax=Ostrinia furnacalis TaxID=93504 RepID=UPI001039C273|nr:uncharacterized protein LOC114349980 [Ostrinia furnacalis]
MNILKRKEALAKIESRCGSMSSKTKNFIQKICYKKSASIDMTRYGFIRDSKVRPINLMMRPLKEQLERIWGKSTRIPNIRKQSPSRRNERAVSTTKTGKTATNQTKAIKKSNEHTSNYSRIHDLINCKDKRRL